MSATPAPMPMARAPVRENDAASAVMAPMPLNSRNMASAVSATDPEGTVPRSSMVPTAMNAPMEPSTVTMASEISRAISSAPIHAVRRSGRDSSNSATPCSTSRADAAPAAIAVVARSASVMGWMNPEPRYPAGLARSAPCTNARMAGGSDSTRLRIWFWSTDAYDSPTRKRKVPSATPSSRVRRSDRRSVSPSITRISRRLPDRAHGRHPRGGQPGW